jgi:hypothetical protein
MTAKIGRPLASEKQPLRQDIAHWQWWVKAELARRDIKIAVLAKALNLSPAGMAHRLSLRAEWPVAHLRTLAELIDKPLADVLAVYPDMRQDSNRYITQEPST